MNSMELSGAHELVKLSFLYEGDHGKPDIGTLRCRQQLMLERLGILVYSLQ